jgi:hypothetical protein
LKRNSAIIGDPNYKDCIDWHWMQYRDGACEWAQYSQHFEIARDGLKIHRPITSNGDVDCLDEFGERRFPRLDYSKGFPDWWFLDHTSINVPSQHTQEGKRYDAELNLAHFYQIEHEKNQVRSVCIVIHHMIKTYL